MPDTLARVTPGRALVSGIDRTLWRAHVWAADDLTPSETVVALAYVEHAGRGTTAVWVAPDRLELMTGLARTARKAAVRGLVTKGWLLLTEAGRGHRAARYALTVPAHPSGRARALLDAQDDVPATAAGGRETTPEGVGIRPPDLPRGSESGTRGSESDRLEGRNPTPNFNQNTNQNTNPRASVDEQLVDVRRDATGRLVVVIQDAFPTPTAGLRLEREADALRAAGWTPETLAQALAAVDLTGARSPAAVLRGRLRTMAEQGPARPSATVADPTTATRCPIHGTSSSGACSSCSADHKAGQHRDDADGPCDACPLCKGPTSSRRHAA